MASTRSSSGGEAGGTIFSSVLESGRALIGCHLVREDNDPAAISKGFYPCFAAPQTPR